MTLWFFLVVSWSGAVDVRHGFPSLEACQNQRAAVVQQMSHTVRTVTECVGLRV